MFLGNRLISINLIWAILSIFVLQFHALSQVSFNPKVIASNLDKPVAVAAMPVEAGKKRLLVAQRAGKFKIVDLSSGNSKVVVALGENVPGEEIQVIDLVLHPKFKSNRQAFISYVLKIDSESCIFNVEMVGVPEALVEGSIDVGRELFREDMPCGSAMGGGLAFGVGDELYIGVGVGRGVIGKKTAQDVGSLAGKILRVSVDKEEPYGIPDSNPYISAAQSLEPIWAIGFRDPYRLSFDKGSKKLFVIDRGTGLTEEVNRVVAKGNYGWPMFEGTECQMMRFDCIGKKFRAPIFSSSGKGGNYLTGAVVVDKGSSPFLKRFVFAKAKKGEVFAIGLAKTRSRLKVPLGFSVDSVSLGHNNEILLISTAAGVIRQLD